ncbi:MULTISPECIES: universal stress protein [Halobacterium]|uniref:universal stress protein n=1 Tax=Halobacterium TaxID=2239 RepID=UPI00073F5A2B|nr:MULTISPECIES: universal stress protein [Halobacterium]MCG1003899.1 universal stress protein [Halobacterium noricense]
MYDRILVPTDGGDASSKLFAHAADIAARRDATVHVLYVVDDRAFLTLDEAMQDEAVQQLRVEGRSALSEAKQTFEAEGVAVETELRRGDPGEEILGYAGDAEADLVVMGTRRSDFENSMLGSVSREVVASADVPVLTVSLADEE